MVLMQSLAFTCWPYLEWVGEERAASCTFFCSISMVCFCCPLSARSHVLVSRERQDCQAKA